MPKDNKKNNNYSKEFKESVLKRLEPPANESVPQLSKELGISKSTIYQWVRIAKQKKGRGQGAVMSNKTSTKWNSEDNSILYLKPHLSRKKS